MSMPGSIFRYKAIGTDGRTLVGSLEATTPDEAMRLLRAQGLIPWKLQQEKAALVGSARGVERSELSTPKARSRSRSHSKVHMARLATTLEQLADLLSAGMPLDRALSFMSRILGRDPLAGLMEDAWVEVRSGQALSDAFARAPYALPAYMTSMVRAGETAGNLEETLKTLGELCARQASLRTLVRSSLTYPLFMLGAAASAVALLVTFILPRFASVYDSLDGQLPAATNFLLSLADAFRYLALPGAVLAVIIITLVPVAYRSDVGRRLIDRSLLKLPLVGLVIRETAAARLAWALAAMLSGGVPLLQALRVARDVTANAELSAAVDVAIEKVQHGASLSLVWKDVKAFPEIFTELTAVGEETGEPASLMRQAAIVLENSVKNKVKSLTALMEPVLILTVALVVGVVVIGILAPIVQLNDLAY